MHGETWKLSGPIWRPLCSMPQQPQAALPLGTPWIEEVVGGEGTRQAAQRHPVDVVQAERQHDGIPDDLRFRLPGAGLDAGAVVAEDAAAAGQRRVEVQFDQRAE